MCGLITCVIPSLNQGCFIEETIKSVISQDCFEKVELVVMDGGSSDDTLNILDRYKKYFHSVNSERDKGQAAAINKGVAIGGGNYVCWLNSDDLLLPGAMQLQIEFLREHPNIKVVHGIGINIGEHGSYLSQYPSGLVDNQTMIKGCPVSQPTMMMMRETWEEVQGLDESLQMCMDYDLWWRVMKVADFGFIPHELACTRIHDLTKTKTMRHAYYRESFKILKREINYIPLKWMINGLFEEIVGCYPRQASYWQRCAALAMAPKYYWNNCK